MLIDDDEHSYDYVIRMMQELFAHSEQKAFEIAKRVDEDGRAVCLTTHKERAEFKRDHGIDLDAMLTALEEEFPPEATWSRPQGGLFLWATLPEFINTRELAARAIERHGVAFVPGGGAFCDGRGNRSMRLNFSGVSESTISEGVHRIGNAIGEMIELQKAFGGGV